MSNSLLPVFATPRGHELWLLEDREHGPPHDLIKLYSPTGCVTYLGLEELEEFERDTHRKFDDVLSAKDWRRLIRWLSKNISLFDVLELHTRLRPQHPTEPDYSI